MLLRSLHKTGQVKGRLLGRVKRMLLGASVPTQSRARRAPKMSMNDKASDGK